MIRLDKRQVLAIIGAVILCMGLFTPLWELQFPDRSVYLTIESRFTSGGWGEGDILLLCAISALVLGLARVYKWLWIPGILGVWAMSLEYVKAKARDAEGFRPAWGWVVLVLGAILLISTSIHRRKKTL